MEQAKAQTPAVAAKTQTAGAVFKNVTTAALKDLTVADFLQSMGVLSADLGLDCADCHPGAGSDKVDWVFDTPRKKAARRMIDMLGVINKSNFGGAQMVTCYTCHHGTLRPNTTIALDTLYGPPNEPKEDVVTAASGGPTAAQILDKYIQAAGERSGSRHSPALSPRERASGMKAWAVRARFRSSRKLPISARWPSLSRITRSAETASGSITAALDGSSRRVPC